jgi:hypothetical protein
VHQEDVGFSIFGLGLSDIEAFLRRKPERIKEVKR